ncbi:glycosyltransferase family 9 protein [Candidatus Magnetomonas plexicatena]|uniref:glycosyltransferase family 9 protein n=1 Tax=Candidatus Magnetomonas plexicatena TaxID=2552947 RepID=UPI00110293C7|nr:glycosyltransferase family 9 protein [Nitrospirales bacterium LBB_01]
MNLFTIRKLDETLGDIICVVLGWLLIIKRAVFPPAALPPDQVKTILCQKYFGMGSILNTLPALSRLKDHYPNAKVILITLKENEAAAQLCTMFDEVLILDITTLTGFLKSCTNIIYSLVRRKINISLDFEFYAMFTLIISFFSFADIKVGLHLRNIRPEGILTHKIHYNPYKHISEIYLNYCAALGIPIKKVDYKSLLPSFKNTALFSDKFNLPNTAKIITINVNCGDLFLHRRWPSQHFITLIRLMIENYPQMSYVVIGGKSEAGYVNGIVDTLGHHSSKIINCAGKTSIEELFALIEMSYLLITNDSGPLHIGSFYGINVAAFFGPETPVVYGPVNNNALVFQPENKYCSPCLNVYDSKKCLYREQCHENTCLTEINPETVYKAIESRFLLHL